MFRRLLNVIVLIAATQTSAYQPPPLPEPVTNNAVALAHTEQGPVLVSMMGLGADKTYQAVHNKVWTLPWGASQWSPQPAVPSSLPLMGRLASLAVAVGAKVYLFGGYTVASDHSEISSPDNLLFDLTSGQYSAIAPMPVAVDDAVGLTYQNRYIYIISGWHNDGNVNLVQVYDIKAKRWFQASPFVGKPVFGHAGGIVDNQLVVCDGVAVLPDATKRRSFAAEAACYYGLIDRLNPARISWHTLPHPTGVARYRMAASGVANKQQVVFIGGSDNPYNYNGIGYDGKPATADNQAWIFDLQQQQWQRQAVSTASMDHRGLLEIDGTLVRVGGMDSQQRVLQTVMTTTLEQ